MEKSAQTKHINNQLYQYIDQIKQCTPAQKKNSNRGREEKNPYALYQSPIIYLK